MATNLQVLHRVNCSSHLESVNHNGPNGVERPEAFELSFSTTTLHYTLFSTENKDLL